MAETDLTTAVATEIAKQIPVKEVYSDVGAPAAKEAGGLLADLAKTLRLALAPLQYTAALQDRYVKFLDKAVRRVPEGDRISPPPQILGPVIEGIKYEEVDTPISEMFSHLLSKAFDARSVSEAHPSYPTIIRQLSADEARLLSNLHAGAQASKTFEIVDIAAFDNRSKMFSAFRREVDETPVEGIVFAENLDFYLEHLHNLGLVGRFDYRNQEPIHDGSVQTAVRRFGHLRLTPMGQRFMSAVSATKRPA